MVKICNNFLFVLNKISKFDLIFKKFSMINTYDNEIKCDDMGANNGNISKDNIIKINKEFK
jgi:hypothetical protein